MSVVQLKEILAAVHNDKFSHKQAASKFKVKPSLVAQLIYRTKKDPNYLDKKE